MALVKSEIIESENCRRLLKIEVSKEEVGAEFEKAYKDILKNAAVPGFRKGKVPLNIIKTRYRDLATGEAMKKLISSSLWEAVKEKNLEVVTEPALEKGDLKPDEAFSYTVSFEVRPEIKLGDYKKIKIIKKIKETKEEDIDRVLKDLQERFSRFPTVEDRDLAKGDFALVDIKVTEKGHERVNREGIIIDVEDGDYPGFSEKVQGLKKGEEREFTLKVPVKEKDKEIEEELSFWIRLREVKTKQTPPIDDGLAKDAGFDTLEDLKIDIRKRLEDSENMRSYNDMRNQVSDYLLSAGDLTLPESIVKEREESLLKEARHNMEREGRIDEYREHEEEIKREICESNIKQIKLAYLLDEIGKRENIDVTKEEIEEGLKGIFGEDRDRVKKAIEEMKEADRFESYVQTVREKKVYKYLIDNSEIQIEKV